MLVVSNSTYRWRCGGSVSMGPLAAATRSFFLLKCLCAFLLPPRVCVWVCASVRGRACWQLSDVFVCLTWSVSHGGGERPRRQICSGRHPPSSRITVSACSVSPGFSHQLLQKIHLEQVFFSPPCFFPPQPFMSPRYPGGPRPALRMPNQVLLVC